MWPILQTRMEILSGMFLAILLLQYTVRGYLPGTHPAFQEDLFFCICCHSSFFLGSSPVGKCLAPEFWRKELCFEVMKGLGSKHDVVRPWKQIGAFTDAGNQAIMPPYIVLVVRLHNSHRIDIEINAQHSSSLLVSDNQSINSSPPHLCRHCTPDQTR